MQNYSNSLWLVVAKSIGSLNSLICSSAFKGSQFYLYFIFTETSINSGNDLPTATPTTIPAGTPLAASSSGSAKSKQTNIF